MLFSENFRQALRDYILLLEKKYPEKTVLEMVATRYGLNHFERSIIYRGISTIEKAARRKTRQITIEQLNHQTLHIDLFNVLYTLAAYLRGFPVFISIDGMVRDASESHGSGEWEVHLDQGLDLLVKNLESINIQDAVIYIDNPLNYGLAIGEKLKDISMNSKPLIRIIADPSPDHLIRGAKEGIISTSDSTIIDKSELPVLDLPKYILERSFHKALLNLNEYI